jgi:hypothetical protein
MKRLIWGDQKGVALIVALIMLLVLTLIGMSSISSTFFESKISGNERVGTNAFYAANAGIQVGLNQLPDTKLIPVRTIGTDSSCWSGSLTDKGSPKELKYLGPTLKRGFDSAWGFNRYQVNATGESFGAMKEVEVQATWGPFNTGTVYN